MLILKQAMKECNISQQALVKASGYSKALISRALNGGEMPKDEQKFRNCVAALVGELPALGEWLSFNGMKFDDLFRVVGVAATRPSPDLERVFCEIAGRAVLGSGDNLVLCLVRAASHLHRKLVDLVGEDAPWIDATEAEVFDILKGVRP